ncbi:SAMHD1 [Mytilus coruscus]|uniref:SAMHD1 n=1 Tax=Mytilus coruscus TaxID=42192 RepID=A0A6J8CGY1_MYTCO|nr:SAMHD1 [Mytilus coruscus]
MGKKRKSKSIGVPASKRNRSDVSSSESVKEEESQPSTSASLPVGEGYETWSEEDVAMKLEEHSLDNAAKVFREEGISGKVLHMLNGERLEKMGINKMGERLQIMKVIMEITGIKNLHKLIINTRINVEEHKKKILNDPVNGHTEVHSLCIKIIDTSQFQRLRDLKQSGTCYFVYPRATNNSFEHCIGFQHEDASVMMFDYLIEKHNLMGKFEKYDLINQDIKFTKEQIEGPKQKWERTADHQKREKHMQDLKKKRV